MLPARRQVFFKEKLEKLRVATNAEGRDWLTGLMLELEKWTRAHDLGGWRYEFQCSNLAESFNKLLGLWSTWYVDDCYSVLYFLQACCLV
jgi:hypothetical protein